MPGYFRLLQTFSPPTKRQTEQALPPRRSVVSWHSSHTIALTLTTCAGLESSVIPYSRFPKAQPEDLNGGTKAAYHFPEHGPRLHDPIALFAPAKITMARRWLYRVQACSPGVYSTSTIIFKEPSSAIDCLFV